jgi:hypothetical protein
MADGYSFNGDPPKHPSTYLMKLRKILFESIPSPKA